MDIDTVEHLLQPLKARHIVQFSCSDTPEGVAEGLFESFPGLEFALPETGQIRVESAEPVRVGPLVRYLEDLGIEVMEARRIRPSLEDVFVKITGIEAQAMRREKEKKGGGQ